MPPATFAFGGLTLTAEPANLARAICEEANLTATQLYCKWEAWALNHDKPSDTPSAEDLNQLAAQFRSQAVKAAKAPKTPRTRTRTPVYTPVPTPTRVNVDDFFSYFDDPGLAKPPTADPKPDPSAEPVPIHTDRPPTPPPDAPPAADDDGLVLAGASIGRPRDVVLAGDDQPDSVYANRDQSGRVEAVFNAAADLDSLPRSRQPVRLRPLAAEEQRPRYMNDAVPAKIDAVRARVRHLGDRILARVRHLRNEDELPKISPESFFVRSPDVVLAVGRIRVELEETDGVGIGRINANSVVLESEEGNMVKLNLSRVHEKKQPMFLNSGMVVVVEGVNTNGRCIQVHAVYDNAMSLPPDARQKKDHRVDDDGDSLLPDAAQEQEQPFANIIFAAGPFTTSTNLNYEPLEDLLSVVERARPDAVFLTGPFVDASHADVSSATPVQFEHIFETRVLNRLRKAVAAMTDEGPRTEFVLVPSLMDVHHDFVCPQPAFRLQAGQPSDARIRLVANPSVVELASRDGAAVATVGVANLPSLQDISADCICWNKPDRFAAIASHMVRQCSFYPTFPPSASVPLDCSLWDGMAIPDTERWPTVDVLVTPSRLKAFAKSVDGGAVAVNPGLLCRGSSGGSYAEMRIPLHEATSSRGLNANEDKLKASIIRL